MGNSGLKKAIDKQKINDYYQLMLNDETYRYVFRILAIKEILTKHRQYGFILNNDDYYHPIDFYNVTIDTTINNIAEFAIKLGVNYKKIKQLNPWLRTNTISNPNNTTYNIKIPSTYDNSNIKKDTIIHICEAKENLFEIARKYNIDINQILSWNNLIPSKKLKKKQEIIIIQ